jgi:hypothetical protein
MKLSSSYDLSMMRQFCGWLSADVPELHHIEIPRMEDSLRRFIGRSPAEKCRGCGAPVEWSGLYGDWCAICKPRR